MAERPVETLKEVPRGVGRWFKRTSFKVREAYHDVSETVAEQRAESETGAGADDGEQEDEMAEKAEIAARKELRKHLRISAAERRWYRELGIDPSTDNEKLRTAIESVARVEGLTAFGMKLVALPSIPGSSQMRKTMDLVWSSDPVDLLRENRRRILNAGLTKETARAFEESFLTLTEQTIFLDALEELAGVAGRQHLLSRALGIGSRERAQGLTSITVLLARLHRKKHRWRRSSPARSYLWPALERATCSPSPRPARSSGPRGWLKRLGDSPPSTPASRPANGGST